MAKIQLTQRDEELLRMIARYGIISVKAAGYVYQTKSYHQNRINVLGKAGYVTRSNGIKLASKGRKYLIEQGVAIRSIPKTASYQNRAAAISELAITFAESNLVFLPSWDAKTELNLSASSKALGVVKNDMLTIIYGITEDTRSSSIKQIKAEMQTLQSRGITRAVILAENKAAMDKFPIEACGLSEQLLLPWNDYGIALLIKHIKENLCYKSAKLVLKEVNPSRWTLADYNDSNENPVIVMTLNDIEKRAKLEGYYRITNNRHVNSQQVTIICLQSQYNLFAREFPKAHIQQIPDYKLLQPSEYCYQ